MADIHGNQQPNENHAYREYGGTRPDAHVVWQGPTDEALHGAPSAEHAYEYEQAAAAAQETPQIAVDGEGVGGEQAEWRSDVAPGQLSNAPTPSNEGGRSWEPLNLKRESSRNTNTDPEAPPTLPPLNADTQFGGTIGDITTTDPENPKEGEYAYHHQTVSPTMPPPSMRSNGTPDPSDGYHTPLEAPPPIAIARPASPGLASPSGGKISAAAFRRGAKPRQSTDGDEVTSPIVSTLPTLPGGSPKADQSTRRLPVPPAGAPDFPPGTTAMGYPDEKKMPANEAYADAPEAGASQPAPTHAPGQEELTPEELATRGPPPSYGGTSGGDSLR